MQIEEYDGHLVQVFDRRLGRFNIIMRVESSVVEDELSNRDIYIKMNKMLKCFLNKYNLRLV